MQGIRRILAWTYQQASGVKAGLLTACVVGIVRVAISLYFVWLSKLLVDAATGKNDLGADIVPMSVALAALMIAEMVLQLTFNYTINKSEVRLKKNLRTRIFGHLMHSCWYKKDRMHSGDLLNRLTEDIRTLSETLCQKAPFVLVTGVQLVAALILLAYLSLTLALCILCILPAFLLLSKVYVKRSRRLTSEIRQNESNAHALMQEGLQHHMVVQTFEKEDNITNRMDNMQDYGYGQTMKRTRLGLLSNSLVRIGFIGGYLTAFLWSVWHLQTGAITFGSMTAFLQLVARIQNPMQSIMRYLPSIIYSLSSAERLMELTDMPGETKDDDIRLHGRAGIRINGLKFRYNEGQPLIFNGLDYTFEPGTRTVIMGETGVGKSTLIKLFLALLKPDSGTLELYDGTQSIPISPSSRCNIAYVPQGNSLLEGTVKDNLLMGNPDATDEQISEALHIANAEFVYDMPDGLNTQCGELGVKLSEGQAQRIAIARALLRDSKIMLMDEFNSSLDQSTAQTLMERLISRRRECTMIFISHRPEIIGYCDNVLRLERGHQSTSSINSKIS